MHIIQYMFAYQVTEVSMQKYEKEKLHTVRDVIYSLCMCERGGGGREGKRERERERERERGKEREIGQGCMCASVCLRKLAGDIVRRFV